MPVVPKAWLIFIISLVVNSSWYATSSSSCYGYNDANAFACYENKRVNILQEGFTYLTLAVCEW